MSDEMKSTTPLYKKYNNRITIFAGCVSTINPVANYSVGTLEVILPESFME